MKMRYDGTRGSIQGLKNERNPDASARSPLKSRNVMLPGKNIEAMIVIKKELVN